MKFLIGILMASFTSSAFAFSYTKEFTELQLQEKIEALMPLEKKTLFITTIISNPKLDLHSSSNQLSIEASIEAIAPGGIKGSGTTKIEGSVSYNPVTGTFHLDNPRVVSLHINRVAEKYQPTIKQLVQAAISNALKQYPIYTFQDENLKHKLAKSMLKSVTIENEKLRVKLGVL